MAKNKVLYTYPILSSFIEKDIKMLSAAYQVKSFGFTDKPSKLISTFIKHFFLMLWHLPSSKGTVVCFSGYHAFWPVFLGKIFGKPTYIIAGGTDCVHFPNIDYGNFRLKYLKWFTVYSFKNATKILPVAESLIETDYHFVSEAPNKQGIKAFIPDLKTPIEVLYNAYDADFWQYNGRRRKANSFITVATGINKKSRFMTKGIDLVFQIAEQFPEYDFTILGTENYKSWLPNVRILGHRSAPELIRFYSTHEFYLQLSMSEGFPNALCEAMLCGCIPIGSDVGAIRQIIGDSGFVLKEKDVMQLNEIFGKAVEADRPMLSQKARKQIAENYPYHARQEALINLFA
ncbi:glycosyltransferase family 4 protein [Penaeicola halotolerans]|uniref:glycosyltransferase family 4 protein n=1 Tax=Penaeicola halotolerans TaxID=2793196 RepID=UPI001CF8DC58|nr:glycosyltransferase family 4 protein [Penaeicola halotolerans]